MNWECNLMDSEMDQNIQGPKYYQCHYLLKKITNPDVVFSCETLIREELNLIKIYPSRPNGQIIRLNYWEIQDQINELKKKIRADFRGLTINDCQNTVVVIRKTLKNSKIPLNQQIVKKPLKSDKNSFLYRGFAQITQFLDRILPQVQKFFSYFGIKYKKIFTLSSSSEKASNSSTTSCSSHDESEIIQEKMKGFTRQKKNKQAQLSLFKTLGKVLQNPLQADGFYCQLKKLLSSTMNEQQAQGVRFLKDTQFDVLFKKVFEKVTTEKTAEHPSNSNTFTFTKIMRETPCYEKNKKEANTEEDNGSGNVEIEFEGGVSYVKKVKIGRMNIEETKQPLIGRYFAKKSLKNAQKNEECNEDSTFINDEYRFKRQRSIIEYINRSKTNGGYKNYLFSYYYPEKTQEGGEDCYYIDWANINLTQYLHYNRDFLTTQVLLDICCQIVFIVKDLHDCGIVHRDLKPSNFMVVENEFKSPIIKLIDFSDSMIVEPGPWLDEILSKKYKIYSTIMYSPLECSRSNKLHKEKGLNNKVIDLWSVGVILYQILRDFLPISYSPSLHKDIHALWSTEFLFTANNRKLKGLGAISSVFEIIQLKLVQPNQEQRMSLQQTMLILLACRIFVNNLANVCFNE